MQLPDSILGKRNHSWVVLLLSFFLIGAAYLLLAALVIFLSGVLVGAGVIPISVLQSIFSMTSEQTGYSALLLLASVAVSHIAIWAWVRLVHSRSYISLIDPYQSGFKSQWTFTLLFALANVVFSILISLVLFTDVFSTQYVWDFGSWSMWLIPLAIMIFLQSSAEEVFFRGYLQQYLARLFPNRWIYYIIPALIWASIHWSNVESQTMRISVVASIFVMGVIFADWADVTGSLWGPILYHTLNNMTVFLISGNSMFPIDTVIWYTDLSAIDDNIIAYTQIVSSVAMAGVYLSIRNLLPRATSRHSN